MDMHNEKQAGHQDTKRTKKDKNRKALGKKNLKDLGFLRDLGVLSEQSERAVDGF